MLMAFFIWLLGLFGVAPSAQELAEMTQDYNDAGHHLALDFSSEFGEFGLTPGLGLAYEFLSAHRYHSVSLEVSGGMLGPIFKGDKDWYLFGGMGYQPIQLLRLFAQAGAVWIDGEPIAYGRLGVGIRFMFFRVNVMPAFTLGSTADGQLSFGFFARMSY